MDRHSRSGGSRLTDTEIEDLVAGLLPKIVPTAGFQSVAVASDVDFDDEPIIRVSARFSHRPSGKPDALINAVHVIHESLIAQGDDRFVFLTNDVDDERQPELEIEEEEVG